nr:MAG TPA: hypothetical protein [Caudoviricetes sp.]
MSCGYWEKKYRRGCQRRFVSLKSEAYQLNISLIAKKRCSRSHCFGGIGHGIDYLKI